MLLSIVHQVCTSLADLQAVMKRYVGESAIPGEYDTHREAHLLGLWQDELGGMEQISCGPVLLNRTRLRRCALKLAHQTFVRP